MFEPAPTLDVTPAARLGATTALIASAGGVAFWVTAAGAVRSPAIAAGGIAAGALLGVLCLVLPWNRFDRRVLFLPLVVLGLPAVVLACFNSGGLASPYTLCYPVLPVAAAYFATRREMYLIVLACALGAAIPLGYDGLSGIALVRWMFTATVTAGVGLVFHRTQETVRLSDLTLRDLAMRDPLTGVANRRAVEQRAARDVALAAHRGGPVSVCFLDLDGFKGVNDTLGHGAGDRALQLVARGIAGALRDGDLVGRFGGDEFAALLPGADGPQARAVEERMKRACERALDFEPDLPPVTISVGHATYPEDGSSWEELLQAADRRLLAAKRDDRGAGPVAAGPSGRGS